MVLGSSITGTTNVFCDGDGCNNWTPGVTGSKNMRRAARARARDEGWVCIRREAAWGPVTRQMADLCPECAKKARSGDTE